MILVTLLGCVMQLRMPPPRPTTPLITTRDGRTVGAHKPIHGDRETDSLFASMRLSALPCLRRRNDSITTWHILIKFDRQWEGFAELLTIVRSKRDTHRTVTFGGYLPNNQLTN